MRTIAHRIGCRKARIAGSGSQYSGAIERRPEPSEAMARKLGDRPQIFKPGLVGFAAIAKDAREAASLATGSWDAAGAVAAITALWQYGRAGEA